MFVSGQGPINPDTGRLAGTTIEEQTTQTLQNVKTTLEAASSSLNEVVKVTVIMTDLSDFPKMNAVYETFLQEPFPTRTTFGGSLAVEGMLIENDAVARRRG